MTFPNLGEYVEKLDDNINVFQFKILGNNPTKKQKLKLKKEWLHDKKRVCEAIWKTLPQDKQEMLYPELRKKKLSQQM